MAAPILYCGDTDLTSAAAYLAGLLTRAGLDYQYVPSRQPLRPEDLSDETRLVILSDYPAARMAEELQQRLVLLVERGTGLLMIGGWESFHGLGGDWDGTPVGEVLPVDISTADDRLNSDQPLLVRRVGGGHPVTDGLPWEERPPCVGGLNRFTPRPQARVLLEADRLCVERDGAEWRLTIAETWPLLVVGEQGRGRTAALATDVAPHWVGGLVDWGSRRVAAQAPGADAIEVGEQYAQFFTQLLLWTKG